MTGGKGAWRRSSAAKALLLVALSMSLALGIGFVVINSSRNAESGTLGGAEPMTDAQATNQVLDSARQIVDAARLQNVSASHIFLSCTSSHDPPYQAAVYLNFALPESNPVKRIREVAAAMVAHGWQQAPAMAEHFGLKLTRGRRHVDIPPEPRRPEVRHDAHLRGMPEHLGSPQRQPGLHRHHRPTALRLRWSSKRVQPPAVLEADRRQPARIDEAAIAVQRKRCVGIVVRDDGNDLPNPHL